MTTFLHNQGWDNVFVTAEQTVYAQKVLETFNPTANKIIKVVGSANITSMPAQTIISQVKDLKPAALLYIGKPELATALLDEMNRLNVEIPLVGLDTLSESTFLSKYVGAASVYYASSLFNIKAAPSNEISAFYRTTLAGKMDAPFASETLEAVWFIYSALNSNQTGNGLRDRVWNGMNQSTSLEWNGELTGFTNHWRTPRQVFFYELTLEHPDPSLFLTMEQ